MFYHEMNTQHSNLQFTLERSTEGRLPFLDTEVKLILNRLHTNIYRKMTDTNLVILYTIDCPKTYKLGLINSLLNKTLNLCTNYVDFKEE